MNNLGDYLEHKASQLNLGRANDLSIIQAWLDGVYPGKAKALSLNNQKLTISAKSSVIANELRFHKYTLMQYAKEKQIAIQTIIISQK